MSYLTERRRFLQSVGLTGVGVFVGALGTALLLVGTFGSQVTQQVLIGIAAVSSLLMFGQRSFKAEATSLVLSRVAVIVAFAAMVASIVPPLPGLLVAPVIVWGLGVF